MTHCNAWPDVAIGIAFMVFIAFIAFLGFKKL